MACARRHRAIAPRSADLTDLVYVCDWLPPDFGAVGQYGALFARELAQSGLKVVLIGLTSKHPSDDVETLGQGSLRTIKIAARPYDKSNARTRLLWTLKTNTRLLAAVWPHARRARRILFTGSPPLFLHWIAPANLLLRKELTYRITDFHPECSIAARGRPSLLLRLVHALTLFWRRRVARFEVLGHDQARRLAAIGIPAERITLKPDPSPVRITAVTQPLPRPPAAQGKALLLYSGNWGVAHDTETFLVAYLDHYRNGPGTVFLWLNAVGHGADRIYGELTSAGLPFIRRPPLPVSELGSLLITPDAHLITLSDAFVGLVLPSKVHGCLASRRPIVFIGSEASDVHRLCTGEPDVGYERINVGDVRRGRAVLDALGRSVLGPSETETETEIANNYRKGEGI